MVASKYYWPGLTNDVKAFVSYFYYRDWLVIQLHECPYLQVASCDTCQRNNHKLQKASGSLRPIPVPTRLWAQVGMDLIGPMPSTPRGNRYIVTLTDYFSKWAEAAALPDKTAHGVARFMYSVSVVITALLCQCTSRFSLNSICRLCAEWAVLKR